MRKVFSYVLLAGIVATAFGMRATRSTTAITKTSETQTTQYVSIPVQIGDDGKPISDPTKWDPNKGFRMALVPIK